jgi:hypothetical protein
MTDSPASPDTRYRERIARWQAAQALAERHFNLLSGARAIVFVVALVLAWLALARGVFDAAWLLAAAGVFIGLMVMHERVTRRRDRARYALEWNEAGLARLEDRWVDRSPDGARFLDPQHRYAGDLDVFGPGSLFQLLSTCRTPAGEETLADWLQGPAPVEVVRDRQRAVAELAADFDLREDLAVAGAGVGRGLHREALRQWAGGGPEALPSWLTPAAAGLAGANVATVTGALLLGWPGVLPVVSLGLSAVLAWRVREPVGAIVRAADLPSRDLDHLSDLIARLEREQWTSPMLSGLRARLERGGRPASRQIRRLHSLIGLLDSRRNQLFMPIAALTLWTVQFAATIERWRRRHGGAVSGWLEVLGEVEALCSLAAFASERPAYPYPELVEGDARFEAEALVHPLLPPARAVANRVVLGDDLRLLVVSGSNMSGKSTLLRAVGINAVLAQAGAPVGATRLRLSPLAIGASFRAQDSLVEGRSRFYAEVMRLRVIVGLLEGGTPVLFLLDELLSGTNSYDRAIGARAVVEHLVDRGAIGLLTTHDLSLAAIADALAPRAANVHFEDTLDDGELRFDYLLRPGVVERSNALDLMRSVGLSV